MSEDEIEEARAHRRSDDMRMQKIENRMSNLEAQVAENTALTRENTRISKDSAEDIKDVRDALVFARVGTKLIKWLGALGAVAVTLWQLFQIWRKP